MEKEKQAEIGRWWAYRLNNDFASMRQTVQHSTAPERHPEFLHSLCPVCRKSIYQNRTSNTYVRIGQILRGLSLLFSRRQRKQDIGPWWKKATVCRLRDFEFHLDSYSKLEK